MLISDGLTMDIFIGQEPLDPDECITLYNTTGINSPNPKWNIDDCGLQVRSRALTYEAAYDNILNVKKKLLGRASETKNNTLYVGIWATSDIIDMPRDESQRCIMVMNFRIIREPNVPDIGNRMPIVMGDLTSEEIEWIQLLGGFDVAGPTLDYIETYVNDDLEVVFN